MIVRSHLRVGLLLLVVAAAGMLLGPTAASAIPAGKIEGEVIDFVSKDGVEGAEVCAIDPGDFEYLACTATGPSGEYALSGLSDGTYIVEFWARSLGYAPQYFDDKVSFEDADDVVIAGGATVSGVDAELKAGGKIEGRVTDSTTSVGIEEVEVCAFSHTVFGGCAVTDGVGDYTIEGLATASYGVEFWAEFLGYETRFYDEEASADNADLISVIAPGATPSINARLSKPASKVVHAVPSVLPPALAPPAPVAKPGPKRLHCRKEFKKIMRHGHKVCIRKHKKKHSRR
ncbi:MAG: MSCRAMM family protein [Solirubrobacterales bacterium]